MKNFIVISTAVALFVIVSVSNVVALNITDITFSELSNYFDLNNPLLTGYQEGMVSYQIPGATDDDVQRHWSAAFEGIQGTICEGLFLYLYQSQQETPTSSSTLTGAYSPSFETINTSLDLNNDQTEDGSYVLTDAFAFSVFSSGMVAPDEINLEYIGYSTPDASGIFGTTALSTEWSLQNATSLVYGAIAGNSPIEYDRNIGMFQGSIIAPSLYDDSGTNPVPEPSTVLLLGIGLLGIVGGIRKKDRQFASKSANHF